jgi:subtilisin family serine protease
MMRRSAAAAVTVAAALLISAATVSPAVADPATDGFWYFDVFHIQNAHDDGITGAGVTIAVIDSQVNLEVPTLQGADIEVQPSTCWDDDGSQIPATSTDVSAQHATNIVSYLVGSGAGYSGQTGVKGIAPDAKVLFFSAGREIEGNASLCNTESGQPAYDLEQKSPLGQAIFRAIDAKADIISISLAGTAHPYVELAIAHAVHEGIVVIAGLANEELELGDDFPSGYNGVVGVQSADSTATPQGGHVNARVDVLGPGVQVVWQGDTTWEQQRYNQGTSIATPIVAGFVALVAQKYPEATGNQLIQSLIRNTGVDDHELFYDPSGSVGYGSASATHMLRVDPTQYEDENPLIADGESPSREQIDNPVAEEDWDQLDPTVDEPSPPAADGTWPLLAIGAAGLVLLALIVTLIIVLATRRARATRPTPPA